MLVRHAAPPFPYTGGVQLAHSEDEILASCNARRKGVKQLSFDNLLIKEKGNPARSGLYWELISRPVGGYLFVGLRLSF